MFNVHVVGGGPVYRLPKGESLALAARLAQDCFRTVTVRDETLKLVATFRPPVGARPAGAEAETKRTIANTVAIRRRVMA